MPLIRLARDKRGLDTLYLLHARGEGRGDTRLRVLYFCTMPQGIQFGRPCLDATTQRLLEQRYPDVAFDWPALLREIEQRRLPPPVLEPHVRRARPTPKAERRPPTSDGAADKAERAASSAKRKRRRNGQAPGDRPGAASPAVAMSPPADQSTPPVTPIIEP